MSGPAIIAPLGEKDFRLLRAPGMAGLLAATTFTRFGGRMFNLAIVLFVLARYHSPMWAGYFTFAGFAPGLCLSPIAGLMLDRLGPKVGMRIDMICSAVLVLAIVPAASFCPIWVPLTLCVIYSLTTPLSMAGVRVFLALLTPVHALERMNAWDTTINAAAGILGPVAAGLVAGLFGPAVSMATIAAFYAIGAVTLGFAAQPLAATSTTASRERLPFAALVGQLKEGIALVFRDRTLRGLAVSYSLYRVTWGAFLVLIPLYAGATFGRSQADTVAGLVWAVIGIASSAGAMLAAKWRITGRERQAIAGGILLSAFAAWPLAAMPSFAAFLLAMALLGLAAGPIEVALLTLRQRRTDPALLGRVLAISISVNMAGTPFGSAMAGWFGHAFQPCLIVASLFSVAGFVATWVIPTEAKFTGAAPCVP